MTAREGVLAPPAMSLVASTCDADDRSPTLDELVVIINREHAETIGHARRTVEHAIRVGAALMQAKALVIEGQWQSWMETTLDIEKTTANTYCRLHIYSEVIRRHNPPSIDAALKLLRSLDLRMHPGAAGNRFQRRFGDEIVAEVKRLRSMGWGAQRISNALGGTPSRSAVNYILDPEQQRRHQRRAAEKRRERDLILRRERAQRKRDEQEQERARKVKARGGQSAVAYAHIRKALLALHDALGENAHDEDFRGALSSAMTSLYNAEDKIGRMA